MASQELVRDEKWYYTGESFPDSPRLFLIVARSNPGKPNERELYPTYLGGILADYGSVMRVEPQTALAAAEQCCPDVIILTNWHTNSYAGEPTSQELVRDLREQISQVTIVLDPPCQIYRKGQPPELVQQEVFAAGVSVLLERYLFPPLTIRAYQEAQII